MPPAPESPDTPTGRGGGRERERGGEERGEGEEVREEGGGGLGKGMKVKGWREGRRVGGGKEGKREGRSGSEPERKTGGNNKNAQLSPM